MNGTATLAGLPDGTDTVLAVANGYRVRPPGQVAVSNGNGSTTLTLVPGQVASTSLTATQRTLDQIEAAGIDVNDPANQNVYSFTVSWLSRIVTPPVEAATAMSTARPVRRRHRGQRRRRRRRSAAH